MTKEILDCRGMPCPQPVLKCKNTIEGSCPDEFQILVDNEPAMVNVMRFLDQNEYTSKAKKNDNNWIIEATKSHDSVTPSTDNTTASSRLTSDDDNTLIFIASDVIGAGDDALGSKLMLNFLSTLPEIQGNLWRIILLNSAVRLACTGNNCLDSLIKLEDSGISILVCGTCLDHFGLLDKKQVGQTTNMLDVVTSLDLAGKIIRV